MSERLVTADVDDARAVERPAVLGRNGGVPPHREPGGGGPGDGPSRRPRLAGAKVATLFLIAGEIMFFAGLVFAFWVLRLAAPIWPPPFQPRLPVGVTGANTLVLLGSSVMMVAAGRAFARGEVTAFRRRFLAAGGLGGAFVAVQGYEWARLMRFGLSASSGTYGATFYTLIGTHGIHVVAALAWLTVVLALAARGRFSDGRAAPLEACMLYWHFVVALWPILFLSVYVL